MPASCCYRQFVVPGQKKQLGDTVHFFRALDLKLMYNPKLAVPYHEGALEFYRSQGVAVK